MQARSRACHFRGRSMHEEAQEYPRQLCEVVVTALKASLLHRDRSAPVQPMTLVVLASCKKCERHKGLVKDLLAKRLETEVVFTPEDLEDLLAELVSLKNQGGNRGGFTPYQPVIGQNPRAHTSCGVERLRSAAPSRPKLRWVYVGARDRTGGPALSRWVALDSSLFKMVPPCGYRCEDDQPSGRRKEIKA